MAADAGYQSDRNFFVPPFGSALYALPEIWSRGAFLFYAGKNWSSQGSHYAASKGGILGLARTLALDVALENICVNTISPGLTGTPQPRAHLSDADLVLKEPKFRSVESAT